MEKKFEPILTVENEVEARRIEGVLQDNKIPHMLRSYHDSAYDGLWQMQKGWGRIEAPAAYKDRIIEIYNDIFSK
jgi:hypothetical protein